MSNSTPYNTTLTTLLRLQHWILQNGYTGYDPYDIKGHSLYRKVRTQKHPTNRFFKRLLDAGNRYYPMTTRKLLNVTPDYNAKGLGLLALGHLTLYQHFKSKFYLQEATILLELLLTLRTKGLKGYGWGYPFHWDSIQPFPKGTPSVVVSCIVGQAFWKHYELTGNTDSLQTANKVALFIMDDLNHSTPYPGTICLSYTPLDTYQVHNANLMGAAYLATISQASEQKHWLETAKKAALFAKKEQQHTGYLNYWGNAQQNNQAGHIDHYHSGFEIRALYTLSQFFDELKDPFASYYSFYCQSFFAEQPLRPLYQPNTVYPIDIHSCAESILLNSQLQHLSDFSKTAVFPLIQWTTAILQQPQGSFGYRIERGRLGTIKNNFPFLRWGQAWMWWALSEALVALKHQEKGQFHD